MLREKWKLELGRRFGVDAEIADARRVLECFGEKHLQARGFALIASLQGLRPTRDGEEDAVADPRAKLAALLDERDDQVLLDLLIVDEAHYLRNPETMSRRLAARLRPAAEYALFLSATPVHNRNEDLLSLLALIDPDSFGDPEVFRAVLEANRPLVQARDELLRPRSDPRRIVELLAEAGRHHLLVDSAQLARVRRVLAAETELPVSARVDLAAEVARVSLLASSVVRTRKRDVQGDRVLREPVAERVPMEQEEHAVYDTVSAIISNYAERRDISAAFLLSTPQRQMTSSIAAAIDYWQRRGAALGAAIDEDDLEEGEVPIEAPREVLGPLLSLLVGAAKSFDAAWLAAKDTKYGRLLEMLSGFRLEHARDKLVLFTSFKTTLRYLAGRLLSQGFNVMTLSGDTAEAKQTVIDRFAASPGGTVLLTTEVGSEGVDLQFCRFLINYDLPWNPMRLEQRIGRLDRLGQTASKITVWNLLHEQSIDERIYTRLVEKLDLCRAALGDFEAVLGDEMRTLTRDILRGHLTAEELDARIDQTAAALENRRQQETELEKEAGGLAIQEQVLQRIEAQRQGDGWITPADLKHYVLDFLDSHYPGCNVQEHDPETVELVPSNALQVGLRSFMSEQRVAEPTKLTRADGRAVICRFANRIREVRGRGPELLSSFHPLVRFIRWRLLDQPWTRPVGAVRLARELVVDVPPGVYVTASSLWRVEGGRSLERLAFAAASAAGSLSADAAEQLMLRAVQSGLSWHSPAEDVDLTSLAAIADEIVLAELEHRFEAFVTELKDEADDRARLLLERVERRLARERDTHQRTLDTLRERASGTGILPATEGKLRRAESRAAQDRVLVQRQRELRPDQRIVAVGLVRVEQSR